MSVPLDYLALTLHKCRRIADEIFLPRNLTHVIKRKEECIVRYTKQSEIFLPQNLTNVIFEDIVYIENRI